MSALQRAANRELKRRRNMLINAVSAVENPNTKKLRALAIESSKEKNRNDIERALFMATVTQSPQRSQRAQSPSSTPAPPVAAAAAAPQQQIQLNSRCRRELFEGIQAKFAQLMAGPGHAGRRHTEENLWASMWCIMYKGVQPSLTLSGAVDWAHQTAIAHHDRFTPEQRKALTNTNVSTLRKHVVDLTGAPWDRLCPTRR